MDDFKKTKEDILEALKGKFSQHKSVENRIMRKAPKKIKKAQAKKFAPVTKKAAIKKAKGMCMNCAELVKNANFAYRDGNKSNNTQANCWVVCATCYKNRR